MYQSDEGSKNNNPFALLPKELLEIIFSFLFWHEFLGLKFVDKFFQNALAQSEMFLRLPLKLKKYNFANIETAQICDEFDGYKRIRKFGNYLVFISQQGIFSISAAKTMSHIRQLHWTKKFSIIDYTVCGEELILLDITGQIYKINIVSGANIDSFHPSSGQQNFFSHLFAKDTVKVKWFAACATDGTNMFYIQASDSERPKLVIFKEKLKKIQLPSFTSATRETPQSYYLTVNTDVVFVEQIEKKQGQLTQVILAVVINNEKVEEIYRQESEYLLAQILSINKELYGLCQVSKKEKQVQIKVTINQFASHQETKNFILDIGCDVDKVKTIFYRVTRNIFWVLVGAPDSGTLFVYKLEKEFKPMLQQVITLEGVPLGMAVVNDGIIIATNQGLSKYILSPQQEQSDSINLKEEISEAKPLAITM